MKKICFLLLTVLHFFAVHILHGQTFEWAKQTGGNGDDYGNSIACDAVGNVFVAGEFNETVDFDPDTTASFILTSIASDGFVVKYDATGNFAWAIQLEGAGNSKITAIEISDSGYIYLGGSFTGITDFDPGVDTFNLSAAGYDDFFICKLDLSGNFIWAKRIGGLNTDWCTSIAIDNVGNILATGSFRDTVDFDPGIGIYNLGPSAGDEEIFICKLSAAGNFIWAKQIGTYLYNDGGTCIATDALGNAVITGYFTGTADFDPGPAYWPLSSAGNFDIFICKFDASGNYLWAKNMGGPANDYSKSMVIDNSGNILTTGDYYAGGDFDPGPTTFNLASLGYNDVFISKLNPSGDFEWAVSMGGGSYDYCNAIATDGFGNVYTTGSFYGPVDFDPGTGSYTLNYLGGVLDIFISKLDSSGNFQWAGQMWGYGSEEGNSMVVDPSGNIYSVGKFNQTCDFDPDNSTAYYLTPTAAQDIYVHKMNQPFNSFDNFTNNYFSVYPNPTNGYISIDLENETKEICVRVSTILGQEIFLKSYADTNKEVLDFSDLPTGVYILNCSGEGFKHVMKIVRN